MPTTPQGGSPEGCGQNRGREKHKALKPPPPRRKKRGRGGGVTEAGAKFPPMSETPLLREADMSKRDIYQEITNKIITLLETVNLDDYEPPFASLTAQGLPFNPMTERWYSGINIPSLWVDQQDKGFASNHWATFKQWKERGAFVRKGEKASPIIFFKTLLRQEENSDGEQEDHAIPMLKTYSVFNADQVDGYDHRETVKTTPIDLVERIAAVDCYCANTSADIRHGGNSAYYRHDDDFIQMPDTTAFVQTKQASATGNYYATLLHELIHWTGASHRLNRDRIKSVTEREKYAFEELIAELGAAFLCSALAIEQTPRDDHALYLKSWLKALKNDKKYIFKASAHAARASEFLNGLQAPSEARSLEGAS